jgi:hypothetical protein
LQLIDLKGLFDVIICAHPHRLDRCLFRSVGGDQNNRRLAVMLPHMPEHVEAAHRFHFNVGDHDLRFELSNCSTALGAELNGKT